MPSACYWGGTWSVRAWGIQTPHPGTLQSPTLQRWRQDCTSSPQTMLTLANHYLGKNMISKNSCWHRGWRGEERFSGTDSLSWAWACSAQTHLRAGVPICTGKRLRIRRRKSSKVARCESRAGAGPGCPSRLPQGPTLAHTFPGVTVY